MRSLLVALSLVMGTNAFSQDSLLMKAIESAASRNYDRIKRTTWHLTRDLVVGYSGLSGTQVSYHYDGDELIRIVCSGYNELGQWGKEYYRIDGELQFVYMSQEYFNDKKPVDAPMSWKDLPTDEYRIYIKKGKQVAVSPAGWKGTVPALLKEYDALMRWGK